MSRTEVLWLDTGEGDTILADQPHVEQCRPVRCSAVAGSLDPELLRMTAYGLTAVACLHVGWRERTEPPSPSPEGRWPAFLFITAAVLLVMAVSATGHLGDWITEIGRRRALAGGWYDRRRELQAVLVGSVGVIWFALTAVAVWRVPERRRRYLAPASVMFTLMCVAGVRMVSLHQVDAVLHRRQIAGVRFGLAIELALLGLLVLTTYWRPFVVRPGRPAGTSPPEPSRHLGATTSRREPES